jgi:hypothetical protein
VAAAPSDPRPAADDRGEQARALGRAQGELFDSRLREREGRQREELLLSRLQAGDESDDAPLPEGGDAAQLRRQVERLSEFHTAVVRSRSWRVMQALRRPFGRAW